MSVRASLTAVALATLAAGAAPPQAPDLSGTWVLNQEESDDARAQLRDVRDDAAAPAGGGNTGKRRPATPHAGSQRRAPAEQPRAADAPDPEGDAEATRAFLRTALQPARRLVIAQPDSTVVLTADGGRSQVLITDGRPRTDSLAGDTPMQISATWEDAHLVVTRRIGGRELLERYVLSVETEQLIVETRLTLAHGDPVSLRRVYDAATGQPPDRATRRPEREPPRPPPRERPDHP